MLLIVPVLDTSTVIALMAFGLLGIGIAILLASRRKRTPKRRMVATNCAECGEALTPGLKFCAHCGAPAASSTPPFRPIDLQRDNIPLPGGLPTTVRIPETTGGTGYGSLSDGLGSFLYFWMVLGSIVVPVLAFVVSGLNAIVIFLFFGIFPIVGVASGYMFCRFRFSAAARDLNQALKKGSAIVYHIGIDNKAKLVAFRRGSTGRWHGPQMKLNSDSTHKATYPFYGTVSAVAHSLSISPLNADFMYYVTKLLDFSDRVGKDGPDGKKKNMAEIADVMQYLDEREAELGDLGKTVDAINNKQLNIDEYIDNRYHDLYWKDGKNFDQEVFDDLKSVVNNYCNDEGKLIKEELVKIREAKQITVEHRDFHMEFDKDLSGRTIGGRLVEDRVLRFDDFRNAMPTGGTAESGFLTEQFAKLGGQAEGGITNTGVVKMIFVLLGILFVGVVAYLVLTALHIT